jgi:hypothetical protein
MLSIITRAGIDAEPGIFDLALCVATQSDLDFEWILVVRPGFDYDSSQLKHRINSTKVLKDRTKVFFGPSHSRGQLLNIASSHAKGTHLVVLDDDDLITSNYVEVFNSAAKQHGQVAIRTLGALKYVSDCERFPGDLSSVSKCQFQWNPNWDAAEHLLSNHTPCMIIAFPLKIIRKFGLEWDPNLVAVEDWDFLLKVIRKSRVVQIIKATSIYRQSAAGSRSLLMTSGGAWKQSELEVRGKIPSYISEIKKIHFAVESVPINASMVKEDKLSIFASTVARKLKDHPFLYFKAQNFYRLWRRIRG